MKPGRANPLVRRLEGGPGVVGSSLRRWLIAGYELFAPLSADGVQPGFALVDELRQTLAEVARATLDATSIAELVPKAEAECQAAPA